MSPGSLIATSQFFVRHIRHFFFFFLCYITVGGSKSHTVNYIHQKKKKKKERKQKAILELSGDFNFNFLSFKV